MGRGPVLAAPPGGPGCQEKLALSPVNRPHRSGMSSWQKTRLYRAAGLKAPRPARSPGWMQSTGSPA